MKVFCLNKISPVGLKVLPPLIAHYQDGEYTKEVKEMFKIEGIK